MDKVLPQLYENIRLKILELIKGDNKISFTTDCWTSESAVDSYISLTAHWLDEKFERHSALLQCENMKDKHTAENLLATLLKIFERWNISSTRIHLILRDNAANIIKALRDGKLPNVGCFAHTLQLCIN